MLASNTFNPHPRAINIDEYIKMAEVGILKENEALELINGEILEMSPIGFFHSSVIGQLTHLLNKGLGNNALIWVQNSIFLDKNTLPEPDIAIVKYRKDFYRKGYVTAKEVLLIIEVSDSTLKYDKNIKSPLYARFNIPEMWIVDVKNQCLICYSQPIKGTYQTVVIKRNLKKVSVLDEVNLDLSNLF